MWLIVFNPQSGNGTAARKRADFEQALQNAGITYTLRLTEKAQHATSIVRAAIEQEGIRQIVAVGGDGTLNEVVNGMMQQNAVPSAQLTLAVIPLGTGNDWIKTHNIRHDWRAAIQNLVNPRIEPHDVGLVTLPQEKRYFINIAGLAYDAFVVRYMNEQDGGTWLPAVLRYFYMILRCLFAYKAERVRVVLDGDTVIDELTYTVHVGICRYSGGGCTMVPHALPADGLFAVTVIRNVSVWNAILSTPLFYNGKIGTHPQASIHSAKHVQISPTLVELDGELCAKTAIPSEYHILPLALNVVVAKN